MRGQRGKVAFFSQRTGAFFVALALLLLFSCGLPTSDYLYPPADFLSPSSNIVRLIHDTSNIDIAALFKGYEIYYRVFDSETDANSSYNYLYNNLTSSNISTVASSKGYYVLVKYNDSSAPLIPVSDNSYDYFDLNLNASSRWTITSEVGSTTTTLSSVFRDKDDSTTTTSSDADFYVSGQYSSDDHDYEGDGVSSGSSVYIVFFAVSCGVSSSLNDFYSEPIVLEPITYTPGP